MRPADPQTPVARGARRRSRWAAVAALALLVPAGLVACGSSEDPVQSASLRSAEPAANGIDDLSVQDLLSTARTALDAQLSYRLSGQTSRGTVDLSFVKDKGTTGTTVVDGHQLTILATEGAVYVKSDDPAYYESAIGPGSAALIGALWVQLTEQQAKDLSVFADPSGFAQRIFAASGDLEMTAVTTVDDAPAVGLVDTGDGSILWISAADDPLPVRLEERGAVGDLGVLRFKDVGAQVPLQAPAPEQIFKAPDPLLTAEPAQ